MSLINFDHINFCQENIPVSEICKENLNANRNVFHVQGRKAKAQIDLHKSYFSEQLNVSPDEIYFSGNSLSQKITIINLLILFYDLKAIYTSIYEHNTFIEYLKHLEKKRKIKLHFVEPGTFGEIDLQKLKEYLAKNTEKGLLCLSHANEYNGLFIPVKEIVKICNRSKVLFLLDLKSSIGKYHIDLQKLNADFATIDLLEHCGERNTGVFYMKQALNIDNDNYRTFKNSLKNTEYIDNFSICKLSNVFRHVNKNLDKYKTQCISIKKYLIEQFEENFDLKHVAHQYHKEGIYTLISYLFPEKEFGTLLAEKLDIEGILVSKIDFPDKINAKGDYIRFTLGADNTPEDVKKLITVLNQIKTNTQGLTNFY